MRRISRNLLVLALGASVSCWSCGDDEPSTRRAAPNEGVLPSAGKPATDNDDEPVPDDEPAPGAGGAGGSADTDGSGGDAETDAGGKPAEDFGVGTELRFTVSADAPTFVNLAAAGVVDVSSDERGASNDWDLVFEGWEIFTNGGASGGGKGAAFGPLPFTYFAAAKNPTDVPFLIEDKAAGAFRDWYFYDGQWHSLYSRYHVYGVKTGERLFKLQLLGYYGDVQGAPISALYHLRYAEVTESGTGDTVELEKLDATAGGLSGGTDEAPSGCLNLASGEKQQLTPSEAAASKLWDLRFYRDSISINGGLGGPGDVTAVDLEADATESETLDTIKALSAENQAAKFEAADYASLTAPSLKYRGDRIVSAFSDAWADTSTGVPELAEDNTWLVLSADGTSRFLLAVTSINHSTTEAPGTVVLRILKVR